MADLLVEQHVGGVLAECLGHIAERLIPRVRYPAVIKQVPAIL